MAASASRSSALNLALRRSTHRVEAEQPPISTTMRAPVSRARTTGAPRQEHADGSGTKTRPRAIAAGRFRANTEAGAASTTMSARSASSRGATTAGGARKDGDRALRLGSVARRHGHEAQLLHPGVDGAREMRADGAQSADRHRQAARHPPRSRHNAHRAGSSVAPSDRSACGPATEPSVRRGFSAATATERNVGIAKGERLCTRTTLLRSVAAAALLVTLAACESHAATARAGNPPSTATQRAYDGAIGSGPTPADGTRGNPSGTATERAWDHAAAPNTSRATRPSAAAGCQPARHRGRA